MMKEILCAAYGSTMQGARNAPYIESETDVDVTARFVRGLCVLPVVAFRDPRLLAILTQGRLAYSLH